MEHGEKSFKSLCQRFYKIVKRVPLIQSHTLKVSSVQEWDFSSSFYPPGNFATGETNVTRSFPLQLPLTER